jgi:hypothetical protein
MLSAMQANHMAKVGDFGVGTRFPLSLVMRADKAKPRRVGPDGNGSFTVGNVELHCAGEPNGSRRTTHRHVSYVLRKMDIRNEF